MKDRDPQGTCMNEAYLCAMGLRGWRSQGWAFPRKRRQSPHHQRGQVSTVGGSWARLSCLICWFSWVLPQFLLFSLLMVGYESFFLPSLPFIGLFIESPVLSKPVPVSALEPRLALPVGVTV